MKKMLFIILIIVVLVSCDREIGIKVVVTEKAKVTTIGSIVGAFPVYRAVTPSGDTVTVTVPEKFRLNNKLPYKATMVKGDASKIGRIVSVDPKQ